jgi:endo-1,4-beta-D-glucanase Y
MRLKTNWNWIFLTIGCLLSYASIGQINTPTPTIPLNSNGSYTYTSVLPSNALGSDAVSVYNTWKSNYVVNCSGTPAQCRVKFDDGTSTVSEGIGYGMLLAAYAGDKATVDCLYSYYKANADGNGLMNWKIGGCSGASGTNGATDADEDAAMALVVAAYQWPTATAPYTYKNEVNSLVTAINKCEIDKNTTPKYQPSNGDGWINCNSTGNTCRNPSYMAPAYYHCWASSSYITSTQPTASWSTVETAAINLVNANANGTTGLVTDWSDPNGNINTCNGGVSGFGYDASRNPWRMAVYYSWYGNTVAQSICNKIAAGTQAAGPANVGGPIVPPSGAFTGTHNATFVSVLAAGTFGSTTGSQANSNAMYTQMISTTDALPSYFGNTLRALMTFYATKNFWNPCNVGPTLVCKTPNFGISAVNTCINNFPIVLNTNTPSATNVTFTWSKLAPSTATLVNASSTANTYTITSALGAGTYMVSRDSSGCSQTDTVVISSTLSTPTVASPIALCSPSYVTLSPSNIVSFPTVTGWTWSLNTGSGYNIISNTSSISYVRVAGVYKVTASIAGCSSSSATVTVTSSLPTPVDACINAAGSVTLQITNPGLGAGPYNWYASSTGGLSLGTGTSFTTTVSGTTVFWVQDMGATSATVGPTSLYGSQTNWGVNTGLWLNFTATQNFTINSFQIPFISYNTTAFTVTVDILNSSGVVVGTFTSQNVSNPGSGTSLLTVSFSPGIYVNQASWGSNLSMRINSISPSGNANPVFNSGVNPGYPFNSNPSGIVTITGASNGGTNNTTDYMYFYNWNVSTGTPCNRLPVIANVNGSCSQVLGIDFVNLSLSKTNSGYTFTWSKLFGNPNGEYTLQGSSDGVTFANMSSASSSDPNSVTLGKDELSEYGYNYFRVLYKSFGGENWTYSNIVSYKSNEFDLSIYPNPFQGNSINLEINGTVNQFLQVSITNAVGHQVYQKNLSPTLVVNELNVGYLPSGMYQISVCTSDGCITKKIISIQ